MFCVSIVAKNSDEAVKKMAEAASQGLECIFELRLDLMAHFDLAAILRAAPGPVLATYRSAAEGGKGAADPQTQAGHILAAVRQGASFADVELRLPREWRKRILAERGDSQIIVSVHDRQGTPGAQELQTIFDACVGTGADIVKIVATARTWADNLRVLELIPKARDRGVKIIAFCMGPLGRISRLMSSLMGAHLTFVSLERGQESAPGQIPAFEMKKLLEAFSA